MEKQNRTIIEIVNSNNKLVHYRIINILSILIVFWISSCGKKDNITLTIAEIKPTYGVIETNTKNAGNLKYPFTINDKKVILHLPHTPRYYQEYFEPSEIKSVINNALDYDVLYNGLIQNEASEEIILDLLTSIDEISNKSGYDIIQVCVAFVQSIPYDHKATNVKSPIETLIGNTGDCDDKSVLLATLLNYYGIDFCLFLYERNQHMALGIGIEEEEEELSLEDGYVYVETTGVFPIGEVPKKLDGIATLANEKPHLVKLKEYSNSVRIANYSFYLQAVAALEKEYGGNYNHVAYNSRQLLFQIKQSKKRQNKVDKELEMLKSQIKIEQELLNNLKSGKQTNQKHHAEIDNKMNSLNAKIEKYNITINHFNNLNKEIQALIQKFNSIN